MNRVRLAPNQYHASYHVGYQFMDSLGEDYDQLVRETGAPLTASATWLRASLPRYALPWAVTIYAAGRLAAAAVLLDGLDEQVTMTAGTTEGLATTIPARDPAAARALAAHLGRYLRARAATRTHIKLGPLIADDVTWTIATDLQWLLNAQIEDGIPQIVRDHRRAAEDYMSDNMRRTLRKARNRLARDERRTNIEFTSDPRRILPMLPAMAAASRERDRHHGVPSFLDTEGQTEWRRRLNHLLREGALEVGRFLIDGQLAAYVLALPDDKSYRILQGCYVTHFARYSPGRLLEAACLQRMLDQPGFNRLDWMTSIASETLIAQNHREPVLALVLDARAH